MRTLECIILREKSTFVYMVIYINYSDDVEI